MRLGIVVCLIGGALALPSGVPASGCDRPDPASFAAPVLVDGVRAGSQPSIVTTPDGTLVLTASTVAQRVASEPDANAAATAGQSGIWRSVSGGATWTRVSLAAGTIAPSHPAAGLNDPDLTVDALGGLYQSDAVAADSAGTVAVSRSQDGGGVWAFVNPAAATNLERPWLNADGPGVVYLTANQSPHRYVYRSVDGGLTFSRFVELDGGYAKPALDPRTGALYASTTRHGPGPTPGTFVAVSRAPGLRAGDTHVTTTVVASPLNDLEADASAVDSGGNVYVVWARRSSGGPGGGGGIWFAASTDGGDSFSSPRRIDRNPLNLTVTMPFVIGGPTGHVAVAWLESSNAYRRDDALQSSHVEWRLHVATSTNASGCAGFSETVASQAIHRGPMCFGVQCDLGDGNDGRMGDRITATVNADGRLVVVYPDTLIVAPSAAAHPVAVVSVDPL